MIIIDTPLGGTEKNVDESFGKGFLHGTVLSSESNKPILNARIFIKGTSIDARSNEDGYFQIEVPANVPLSVAIVYPEHSSQTLNNVFINKSL